MWNSDSYVRIVIDIYVEPYELWRNSGRYVKKVIDIWEWSYIVEPCELWR